MTSLKRIIGTLFGIGYLPPAPGTWASLFTLFIIYGCSLFLYSWTLPVLLFLFITLSLITSPEPAIDSDCNDPSWFVMDECAGQTVPFLLTGFTASLQHDLLYLLAGFIFFRFFDIAKPLGVNRLQNLPGKIGILADDLLAGFYALICMQLMERFIIPLF